MTVDGSCCRPTPRGSSSTPSGVARICVSARSIARCEFGEQLRGAGRRRAGLAFVLAPAAAVAPRAARRVRRSRADRARRRDAARGTRRTRRPPGRARSDRPTGPPSARSASSRACTSACAAGIRSGGTPSMGPRCQASSWGRSDMVCRSYLGRGGPCAAAASGLPEAGRKTSVSADKLIYAAAEE